MKWHLSDEATATLLALPETGMGFQWVRARSRGDDSRFLVFNSELAFDVSDVALEPGDDPATILRNGWRVVQALQVEPPMSVIGTPEPSNFVLLDQRIDIARTLTAAATLAGVTSTGPKVTLPSSLVKKVTLAAPRIFHRYSAFNPDRRVDPTTGNLRPGAYGVPESEVPFLPTGFAAVGRLALPNTLPASHHYVIEAATGTVVDFGTVAPAFGQAGGGVEAFFASGATNVQHPTTLPSTIPDE